MDVSGTTVLLKDCYFYLLYKRKGDEQTQIPILLDKTYDSATDTISASFEPTSYFTEKNGGLDIQVFACSTEQDFISEDIDIEDVALWTSFNAQISIAKSQLKDSQTIVAEDMFTKGIAEMSAYLDSAESEADDAEEFASDAEEFAKGTRSDGQTVPHASSSSSDNAKSYKDLAKDWASKIGGAVESGEYSAKYYAAVADTRSQEAEAYALGTKGGTPVPAFSDKNAKDWATKTGSTVDGTNYSSKQYALNAKESADIVEEHATAIDAIYADLTNIDAVATDIQDEDSIINTVADNIQDVNAVAESITDVNTVAGKTTQITTVAGIASDVTTVAGIASDVTAVAGIAPDVSAVEDIKTDVSAVASIDADVSAVSAIKDDVSAVATIDDDVTAVATDISDVSAVASDITKVTAVADDLTNIDAVADDLTNIDNAEANALKAEGWANGTQNGTPVSSDSPYYENNAKYWADAVPDLKDAIDANSKRITNLETKAGDEIPVTYPSPTYGMDGVPASVAPYGKVKELIMNSRVHNQLIPNNRITYTFTVAQDITQDQWGSNFLALSYLAPYVGHTVLALRKPHNDNFYVAYGNNANVFTTGRGIEYGDPLCGVYTLTNGSIQNSGALYIRYRAGLQAGTYSSEIYLVDLNVYFGTSDLSFLGSTNAEILATIQRDYPGLLIPSDYDTGTRVDTTYSAVKSVGKNLVSGYVAEEGFWDDNGWRASAGLKSTTQIKVVEGRTYIASIFNKQTKARINGLVYATFESLSDTKPKRIVTTNTYITIQSGEKYVALRNFSTDISYITADNYAYQLEEGSSATSYSPYMEKTRTLPEPVTGKSAGSVHQIYYPETGEMTEPIGSVDLGSLNWTKYQNRFYATISDAYYSSDNTINLLCEKYIPKADDSQGNMWLYTGRIYIHDENYANEFVFKSAMDGVILLYELATPNPNSQATDPVLDPFIKVEGNGTIRPVQSQTTQIDSSMSVDYLGV